ncbi:hypothetical protein [Brevibacterium sp. CS2]|uniref:hypothetical protein n=1 Tax=Brevibacterium sp. CS2 TaxID=2575923 RepID=UPI0010C7BDC6|nr:hypothetical protein [Brevibacterium sp. CS2]QCP04092.1 hypothetical protein FDF13_01175 [Brevibacterium sp. CS2]
MPVVDPAAGTGPAAGPAAAGPAVGAGPAAGTGGDAAADPEAENAREMPLPHFHQRVSRDRLVAQAELERQARERLRQSRLRRSGREQPRDRGGHDPNGGSR